MTTPLDWNKALENADGSEELLGELVGVFLETREQMLGEIRTAIDRKDAPELRRTAHSLKASMRILGAVEATEAALRLENMGAEGDFSGVEEGWSTLNQEVDRVTAALAEKTEGQGGPSGSPTLH
jgi:HPt (histidine-containing phosphotransfer) domain-containing protein